MAVCEKCQNANRFNLCMVPRQPLRNGRLLTVPSYAAGNGILEYNEFIQIVTKAGQNCKKKSESTVKPKCQSLVKQKCESPLKQTPTKTMAPQHWKAFKVFDKNRDGFITAKEIRTTMRDLGIPVSDKEVKKILATADKNADGKIDYREFSAMLQDSPNLVSEVCNQKEKKERTMYEYLYGMELTEADLHAAFNAFDHDGKGKIEASDVAVVMRTIGISYDPKGLANMISHASNGNGKVEFNEFLKMMSRSRIKHQTEEGRKQSEEDEMRQAFKVFDIDGNGVIDAMELKMTMRNLGENLSDADVRAMIRTADKNGDGKIDYEEFIKMMYNK